MPIPSGPIVGNPPTTAASGSVPRTYVVDDLFVVEWDVVDGEGVPAPGATVTGTVSTPAGTTVAMTVTSTANTFRATHPITAAGRHAWKLTSTGDAIGAVEGEFRVPRELVGLAPITVDPSTDIGYCRLLVTDTDEQDPLLEDAAYEALLARHAGKPRLAAAAALDIVARSEALVSKKITTQDLSTDGPAVAKELRESASALRKAQQEEDQAEDDESFGLEIVPLGCWPAKPWYGDLNL